jgi:Uma2 family endonuclease
MTLARARSIEEELLRLPKDGSKYEFIDGELKRVSPASFKHDALVIHIGSMLRPFARGRGYITGSQAGFWMAGGNLRCPDIGFTLKERLPEGKPIDEFARFAPDLCIEIISISEDRKERMRKVEDYFDSGAQQVWHLIPNQKRVVFYTSPTQSTTLEAEDELDGGEFLPGFRCRVAELFELE